ncbi:MAG: hypothetical protein HY241_00585 [Actinobacteria bacterium]|nr:hypothetical protein [Actinomycetota bacterium]
MEDTDKFDEFLDAAEQLRDSDSAVQITAHTSSVAINGWPATEDDEPDERSDG